MPMAKAIGTPGSTSGIFRPHDSGAGAATTLKPEYSNCTLSPSACSGVRISTFAPHWFARCMDSITPSYTVAVGSSIGW